MSRKLIIGVDFGGVMSIYDKGEIEGSEHKSNSIDMQKLKLLVHRLILISFCGKARAIKTKASILETDKDLFDKIIFVKSKDYKKHVCKRYGCDVMIDDTLDILVGIHKWIHTPYLIWFTGDPS